MINLFDVKDKVLTPTIHCYSIPWLKVLMDLFPDTYLEIYKYIFYTTCPDGVLNPYVQQPENKREEVVLYDLKPTFYVDDMKIQEAKKKYADLCETPILRAFRGAKKMLDKIALYLDTEELVDGKEGNVTNIRGLMKELPDYWASYKKMETELKEEQAKVRGGARLPYHQLPGYKDSKEDDEEEDNSETS